jgi:hypothetical protein
MDFTDWKMGLFFLIFTFTCFFSGYWMGYLSGSISSLTKQNQCLAEEKSGFNSAKS